MVCGAEKAYGAGELEVDHIDGNPKNDIPENLCLLCKAHNIQLREYSPEQHAEIIRLSKRNADSAQQGCVCEVFPDLPPQSRVESKGESMGDADLTDREAGEVYQKRFRGFVIGELKAGEQYTKTEMINAGAEAARCSTTAAARYMSKMMSRVGIIRQYVEDGIKYLVLETKLGK